MGVQDSLVEPELGRGSTEEPEHLGAPEPFAFLNLRLDFSPVLTKAGSKAKCKDPGAVCKPLVTSLYQVLLLLPARLGWVFLPSIGC